MVIDSDSHHLVTTSPHATYIWCSTGWCVWGKPWQDLIWINLEKGLCWGEFLNLEGILNVSSSAVFSWNSNCGKILRIDHIGWNCDHITLRLCTLRIADWSHCYVTSWELHRRRVWRAQQIGLSMEIQYNSNTNTIEIQHNSNTNTMQIREEYLMGAEPIGLSTLNCQLWPSSDVSDKWPAAKTDQIVTWHHGSSYLMGALCNVSSQNCKTTITRKCNTNSSQIQYKYIWECASVQQCVRLFKRHWQT